MTIHERHVIRYLLFTNEQQNNAEVMTSLRRVYSN